MSIAAERAIVAHCLITAEAHDRASRVVDTQDFTDPRARLLYELVGKLRERGHAADVVTIAAKLGRSQRWISTGIDDPAEYLQTLVSRAPPIAGLDDWLEIVRSASVANTMLAYAQELTRIATDTALSAEQKVTEMHAQLPVGEGMCSDQFVAYSRAARDAVQEVIERRDGTLRGLSSGMAHLDELVGGFDPATLVILAGRPSHGKSVYMMDFAHAAAQRGPVFVFSCEMSRTAIAMRGLSSLGTVDFGDLRAARLDDTMIERMSTAVSQMHELPIYIDDRGGVSVDQLRTRARVMARREQPVMIVCDYLTLIAGQGDNRTAQVGYVSRSLKAMAKELNCTVLCVAQLNRGVDARADKRPALSDLRDSGEIEQDADIVMFSYLDEKYNDASERKGIGELIVAKQRNGETGSVYCEWQGRYQRFVEYRDKVPALGSTRSADADDKLDRFDKRKWSGETGDHMEWLNT